MRVLLLTAALCVVSVAPARAQDALAPLAFTHGCWRGTFVGAASVTDERCLMPMLGGRYVRDTHVVRGGAAPYAGETIYAFDIEAQRISYVYFASDGGGARGFAQTTEQGLVFPENRYVDPDGRVMILRSTWRRENEDRFVIITEAEAQGQWRELMRIDYIRAPDLQPPS